LKGDTLTFRTSAPLLAAGAVLALWAVGFAAANGLYRHVDANGRVTYSDVPPDGTAKAVKVRPNVGSKEAVDQIEMARRERKQLEQEERYAAQRRAAATRQLTPQPAPDPVMIPPRRGGYDSTQPPGQSAADSSRRY
jgi:hypothetical protein